MVDPHKEHHNDRISQTLRALAPGPLDKPDTPRALREFTSRIQERDGITMFGLPLSKNMKRVAAVVAAVAVLAGLLAMPPVQALASEFLSIFRVEKFVLVNVDKARMEQIHAAMDGNMGFEETDTEPAAEPQTVGTLAEAASLAGFTPLTTDQYGAVTKIQVSASSHKTFTPHVAEIRKIYQALNLDPNLIPDNIDGQPFDVTINPAIALTYAGNPDAGGFSYAQSLSPVVNVPDGVDMKQLGKAMLMLLGMSEQQASDMSNSIDWSTTLVVPVPTDTTDVQEVTVRGHQGLLYTDGGDTSGSDGSGGSTLVWQENGYVVAVHGHGPSDVTMFAESLK